MYHGMHSMRDGAPRSYVITVVGCSSGPGAAAYIADLGAHPEWHVRCGSVACAGVEGQNVCV